MDLPLRENAYVPPEKLSDYLLSETHPVGQHKAAFVRGIGFGDGNIDLLERELLEIAHTAEVDVAKSSPWGTKYVLHGFLRAPDGRQVEVTTVWILELDADGPRFITAYPR